MPVLGSYKAESFAISLEDEIRRLNAQVDLFWRAKTALLDRLGLEAGMRVLDCGCGPGRFIELLKSRTQTLDCTGLELDPVLADAARERVAANGLENCRIVQGSAENPNLPNDSFDFIFMRLVLEHLPDPVLALRQLAALLRPGGRIAVISNDFEFHLRCWPPVPELDSLYEAYCAARRRDGGDPCIGRRLPSLLAEAGLSVAAFEVEVAHSSLEGDRAFLQAEGSGIPAKLIQDGYLGEDVYLSMVESWRRMLQHPDHVITRPLFVGVGQRPEPGAQAKGLNQRAAAHAAPVKPRVARPDLDYTAPSTPLEAELVEVWSKAMGLERVGVTSNFFDLGGDSLALQEIQFEIRKCLKHELPMAQLFQHSTIRTLAQYIERNARERAPSPPRTTPSKEDPIEIQARHRREAAARRRR